MRRHHEFTAQELGMRFAVWRAQLRTDPHFKEVMLRFGVSRATACRLKQSWRDVNGLPALVRGYNERAA